MANENQSTPTRLIDWRSLVNRLLGEEKRNDEVVYEFSNGRKFKTTDHTTSGIYEPPE